MPEYHNKMWICVKCKKPLKKLNKEKNYGIYQWDCNCMPSKARLGVG